MGFRNLILTQECKLSSQNGYLVVTFPEKTHKIHLSELDAVLIENPRVKMTGILINHLTSENVSVIICDQRHNPATVLHPISGNFHRVKNIQEQVAWTEEKKQEVWRRIITQKIVQQRKMLEYFNEDASLLAAYERDVLPGDASNREGHAAKVYFRKMFGETFVRGDENPKNWALNYGYSILIGYFIRTIAAKGYLTELGIKHKNEFNAYNLACDLMEPFRPLIDRFVRREVTDTFSQKERHRLLDLVEEKIMWNGNAHFLPNAVDLYTQEILNGMKDSGNEIKEQSFDYEWGRKG